MPAVCLCVTLRDRSATARKSGAAGFSSSPGPPIACSALVGNRPVRAPTTSAPVATPALIARITAATRSTVRRAPIDRLRAAGGVRAGRLVMAAPISSSARSIPSLVSAERPTGSHASNRSTEPLARLESRFTSLLCSGFRPYIPSRSRFISGGVPSRAALLQRRGSIAAGLGGLARNLELDRVPFRRADVVGVDAELHGEVECDALHGGG